MAADFMHCMLIADGRGEHSCFGMNPKLFIAEK
jgi:hypothetical protein